jgi:hypothetical protein
LVAGAGARGVDLEFVNDFLVELLGFFKVMQTEVSAGSSEDDDFRMRSEALTMYDCLM